MKGHSAANSPERTWILTWGDEPITSKNSPLRYLHELLPGQHSHRRGPFAARQDESSDLDNVRGSVCQNCERLEAKYREAREDLKRAGTRAEKLEKELVSCKTEVEHSRAYIRKLEAKKSQQRTPEAQGHKEANISKLKEEPESKVNVVQLFGATGVVAAGNRPPRVPDSRPNHRTNQAARMR